MPGSPRKSQWSHTGDPKVLGRLRMVIVKSLHVWCRSEQRMWDYFTNEEEEGERR